MRKSIVLPNGLRSVLPNVLPSVSPSILPSVLPSVLSTVLRTALLTVLLAVLLPSLSLGAESGQDPDPEQTIGEELKTYDFQDMEKFVQDSLGQTEFHFSQLVEACIQGDWSAMGEMIGTCIREALLGQWQENRAVVWQVFLWAIGGALFLVLARSLAENTIADMGYMVVYMGMMALLLIGFRSALQLAQEGIQRISGLLQVFLPVFFIAMAVQGQITAAAMYETAMILLGGMVWLYETVLLTGIRLWMPLCLVEGILPEDLISRLVKGMKKLLTGILKAAFGCAVGLQVIQTLITPYLDAVKGGTLVRLASAIPGVGNSIASAAKLALSAASLVRNGIGVGGLIVMILLAAGPMCKLLGCAILYHGLAACIQPFSDKRLTEAVSAVGEGCLLLLRVLGAGIICFAIMIGLACTCLGNVGR